MKIISSEGLHASRVFLTEFDRVTYSQVAWTPDDVDGIRRALQRKLKLLLLTKGHIVIAASHLLESELAKELFLAHPELLESGAVIPSMRIDCATALEFLEAKRVNPDTNESRLYTSIESAEMAQLIDQAGTVLRWNPADTSGWYRARLVADLEDSGSIICLALRQHGVLVPAGIPQRINAESELSRGAVYRIAKSTGDKQFWTIVSDYADFIYYLGGARAVNSEGVLPQETLMDFSLSDLAGRSTRLSEYNVFTKMLIDVIKSATATHFPVDFLDAITIKDALDLHHIALERQFVEKYHAIQMCTKNGLALRDSERLILTLEELAIFERDLHAQFEATIDKELPAHAKNQRNKDAAGLLNSVASLLIPYYDSAGSAKEIVVSGMRLAGRKDVEHNIANRILSGLVACEKFVDGRDVAEKPIFLSFVETMKKMYAEKMTGL